MRLSTLRNNTILRRLLPEGYRSHLGGVAAAIDRPLARRDFIRNMRLLHDIVEEADLSSMLWLTGGLLLGWARDRDLLKNDHNDADFGYLHSNHASFLELVPILVRHGFQPRYRWRSNEGVTTEWVFVRDSARFEFFQYWDAGKGLTRHYGYFPEQLSWEERGCLGGDGLVQVELRLPKQRLVPFEFLGKTWNRPEHYDRELDAMYGAAWRAPNKEFYCRSWSTGRDSPAVTERTPWHHRPYQWNGDTSGD